MGEHSNRNGREGPEEPAALSRLPLGWQALYIMSNRLRPSTLADHGHGQGASRVWTVSRCISLGVPAYRASTRVGKGTPYTVDTENERARARARVGVGELLIAADWRMRALARAQLLEEGYPVAAWPSLELARTWLAHSNRPPRPSGLGRRPSPSGGTSRGWRWRPPQWPKCGKRRAGLRFCCHPEGEEGS